MLDPLYTLVGSVLRVIHAGFSEVVDPDSALAWGGSIVVLVIVLRALLVPLALKQARSMQQMQLQARALAPQMEELKKRHKGDRETLQAETMKLYAESGTNPLSSAGGAFLPILIQLPIFLALFRVLQAFQPEAKARYGLSAELLEAGANAKILGAPIAAGLISPARFIEALGGEVLATRLVAAGLIVVMAALTYLTMRLSMQRAKGLEQTPQQQQIQKLTLVALPFMLVVPNFFIAFPIGVLLYWFTSNLWTLGQQAWIHRVLGPLPAAAGSASVAGSELVGEGPTLQPKAQPEAKARPEAGTADPAGRDQPGSPSRAGGSGGGKRAAGTRRNKKRKRR